MQKDKFMPYVEARLHQWAEWYGRGNSMGLSYPPVSIEYRLWKEGVVYRQLGPSPLPTNEAAEEIEGLVVQMAMQDEIKAKALRQHYFSEKGKTMDDNAKILKLSRSGYQRYVAAAHQWMEGRLTPPFHWKSCGNGA